MRLQLTKFTRCYVLEATIKSLLNSKNWVNPLYGDVYFNIWRSQKVFSSALSIYF